MKIPISFLAAILLLNAVVHGAPRTSASHTLTAEALDAGGALCSSSNYRNIGSVGLISGMSGSASYALESGYAAQVGDLPAPMIAIEQVVIGEIPAGGFLEFGTVTLGAAVAIDLTIRNPGSMQLALEGVTIDGANQSEFGFSGPASTAVDPGASTNLTIHFTPNDNGSRSATIHITSNADGPATPYDIHLSGSGNIPPTFTGHSVATPYQTATGISFGDILSKASDADGEALTVAAAGPSSAEGGTAVLQAGSILYTPPAAFSGTDYFAVTIADVHGATVEGMITVTIGPAPDDGNPPQLIMLPGGDVGISFQGVSGRSYQIQRSINLINWTTIATVPAAENGAVNFTDEDPPEPNAFYRWEKP